MKRFSNILLVAGGGAEPVAALHYALQLARSNHATLTVVGVVKDDAAQRPAKGQFGVLVNLAATRMCEELNNIVKPIVDASIDVRIKVLAGKPFIEIVRYVIQARCDLVVKSANEDQGLRSILFGSTDVHLMRKCPCPVWIVKGGEKQQHRRILAALDDDPEDNRTEALNAQILEMATSLALSEFSELHIVHAWRLAYESFMRSPRTRLSELDVDAMVAAAGKERKQWLDDQVAPRGINADKDAIDYLNPQLHLVKGKATWIVPDLVQDLSADLVIMGTLGHCGIPGYLISDTAESIHTRLDCSVLTVKPPGFVSPIDVQVSPAATS